MRYRILVVLASVVMVLQGVMAAQDEETWYFAWRPETGEVVAYTAAGEVNSIFVGDIDWEYGGRRLDAQTAIALLQSSVDGEVTLYKLTPESAQDLTSVFNANDIPGETARPDTFIGYSGSYVVISVYDQPFPRSLLINIDTAHTEVLESVKFGICCRFSEDGQTLRYIGVVETNNNTVFTLRERLLETGEEQVIHTIETTAHFEPDLYGERWLYEGTLEEDETSIVDRILLIDGTSQLMPEESYKYLGDNYIREFLDNDLIVYAGPLCQSDCSLEIYSPGDATPTRFILPPPEPDGTIGGIFPIQRIDAERLLVSRGAEYWLIKSNGEPVFIGYHSQGYLYNTDILSPDGRWLFVADSVFDSQRYRLWDNIEEEFVLEGEMSADEGIIITRWGDEEVLVQHYDSGRNYLFRYEDHSILDLPETLSSYFEILPDGTLLHQEYRGERQGNISHYDPATGVFTPLLQDARYIHLVDETLP